MIPKMPIERQYEPARELTLEDMFFSISEPEKRVSFEDRIKEKELEYQRIRLEMEQRQREMEEMKKAFLLEQELRKTIGKEDSDFNTYSYSNNSVNTSDSVTGRVSDSSVLSCSSNSDEVGEEGDDEDEVRLLLRATLGVNEVFNREGDHHVKWSFKLLSASFPVGLHSGDVINHSWRIIGKLGRGEYSEVFYVQAPNGQKRALKILYNYDLAQFEVRILRYLMNKPGFKKAGVVKLVSYFLWKGKQCLVFPVHTLSVFKLIKKNLFYGLSMKLVRHITKHLLHALVFLNKNHVLHLDLKPENLVIRLSDCAVKLIDFSSSHFSYEPQLEELELQSLFYRAPEILCRLQVTSKADIWSVGCLVFELYFGLPLFPGTCENDVLFLMERFIGKKCPHLESSKGRLLKMNQKHHKFDWGRVKYLRKAKSLKQLINIDRKNAQHTHSSTDKKDLLNFITECLVFNPNKRSSAEILLQHKFITGKERQKKSLAVPIAIPKGVKRRTSNGPTRSFDNFKVSREERNSFSTWTGSPSSPMFAVSPELSNSPVIINPLVKMHPLRKSDGKSGSNKKTHIMNEVPTFGLGDSSPNGDLYDEDDTFNVFLINK